jgi:hypothetical protein
VPLIVFALAAMLQQENAAPLNGKVVEFCRANMGNKVGTGECSDLADSALAQVGAVKRSQKDYPATGDYVWGSLVYLLEIKGGNRNEAYPTLDYKPVAGDIIQFRDVKAGRTTRHPDGSTSWYSAEWGHHTAVIASVSEDGKTWKLYEQNTNQRRFVVEGQLIPADIQQGFIRVYRAKPAS